MPRLLVSLVMPGADVTSAREVVALLHVLDGLGLHVGAGRILLDVDERRFAGHLHRFGNGANFHGKIDLEDLSELQPDIRRLDG